MLGNFGGDDKGPSPDQVKAFEAAMKKAGKTIDVKIYEGAGHAFANVNNPWGGYRETAAKDAWSRTDGLPREVPEGLGRRRRGLGGLASAPRGKQSRRKLQRRQTRGRSIMGKSSSRARLRHRVEEQGLHAPRRSSR